MSYGGAELENLIDVALQKGRILERERCVALVRLVAEMYVTKDINPDWMARELIQRIENPKA